MPIKPSPYKMVCPKCGYSKIVRPKSDCLDIRDVFSKCPKCNLDMERKPLNILDNFFGVLLY